MNTKLTLTIEKDIIDTAKEYARKNNISLSKLIENYLYAISSKNELDEMISPFVESLSGVIKEPFDDYKKSYPEHLSEKYR